MMLHTANDWISHLLPPADVFCSIPLTEDDMHLCLEVGSTDPPSHSVPVQIAILLVIFFCRRHGEEHIFNNYKVKGALASLYMRQTARILASSAEEKE